MPKLDLSEYLDLENDIHDTNPNLQVHLWDYVQIVLQRLPIAVGVFLTVFLVAAIYTFTRTPRYKATSQLLVQTAQVDLTSLQDTSDVSAAISGKREFMGTQARLLLARPVVEKVFTELHLDADPNFSSRKDPVAALKKAISVVIERNTFLINISIERKDPKQAADIVNAIVRASIAEGRRRKLGVSEDGLNELRTKADTLRIKLAQATERLQNFMVENNMVSFEKTHNVIIARLRDLNSKLTEIQPERMELQASVKAAEEAMAQNTPITSLPDVIAAPIIKEMKLDLSKQQNEYSQLLERLGEEHPKLQAIKTEISALETRLALEANAILSSLKTRYTQARMEEELIQDAITAQEQAVYNFNKLSNEYKVLKREQTAIEGPYTTIARRIEEIDINRIGGQGDQIFVVAKATVPLTKSWPSKAKHLTLAIVLGTGLAIALSFFLDYMDTTVKGESDIRRLIGSKVLCAIPNIQKEGATSDTVVLNNPKSHAAEAFRSMRTSLAFSVPGEHVSCIVVSSALPSEGKSLVATNLAISQAQSSKRVLLVDADMRKPRLHRMFAIKPTEGLSTWLTANNNIELSKSISLDNIAKSTGIANLDLIPCGPIPDNPSELLESKQFSVFLDAVRKKYDFVVIDSPPGFSLADSLIIAKQTDGLVLVVRTFATPKAATQQFGTRLHEANARLLGVALNNVDTPKAAGYYGYYGHGKYTKYYA
ncbi:polysaccharide biosynthesis tyrosine autokinase [PVC group bacterium]|nr:polysaccharide biosynthesis tyrosine autokinase [PVC group bacterium]